MYKVNLYLSKKWGMDAYVDSDADGTKDNIDTDLNGMLFNHAPEITSTAPSSAREHSQYSYFVTASDAEGDDITLSLIQPESATLLGNNGNGTAILVWNPGAEEVGDQTIIIKAEDSLGNSSEQIIDINVVNVVNDAPAILELQIHIYLGH